MFLRDKSIVYFLIIANLILAIACTNNTKQVHQNSFCTFDVPVVDTLLISSDYGNFKQISNSTATTDFVILHGKHGNAPDEYIYPWDVDVSVEYIYIY